MYAVGLLVVFTQFIGVIECGGVLDLAFVKFFHNDSELHCDSAECDFKFVICLDTPTGGDNSNVEDCFYTRLEEFELPEVSINFNHWPGAMLLKVAIFDRKPSSDELVDTLYGLLDAEPGQGKQMEMHSKTSLTVNFTVRCDKDFYGPLCSTFCVPQNNSNIGHYSCDTLTGALVCHPGWKGRFCIEKVLEPKKVVDVEDNALQSEEDQHPEDRTTLQLTARLTAPSEEVYDNTTQATTISNDTAVNSTQEEVESMATNFTFSPPVTVTEEIISEVVNATSENFTSTVLEYLISTDLPNINYTTPHPFPINETIADILALLFGSEQNGTNDENNPSESEEGRSEDKSEVSNESDSGDIPFPQSNPNFGFLSSIMQALHAYKNNLTNTMNASDIFDSAEAYRNLSENDTFGTKQEHESDQRANDTTIYPPTSLPVEDISSTERAIQQNAQLSEVMATTETTDSVSDNSSLLTNLLEEALHANKPPIASDDTSSLKKFRYHSENITNNIKEETNGISLDEVEFKFHGEENNNTEITFFFDVPENRPLLNGSAGNLETVIRDVLRHEVGDETCDRLGIHFTIVEGRLQYAIYAINGSLPEHMAEKVFKLRPNIESAFVHLASTHHEAPSAAIPHKRRGIPEWGILTVIVGIVFIAIITMRQAQKYCGRTHKALKPQELHEEKDPEAMPTTSAANFMNPVYNST